MNLDLSLDAAALTATLVDVPSVSGDEKVLADAVEEALRALRHLDVERDDNVVLARTISVAHVASCWLATSTPYRSQTTSRRVWTAKPSGVAALPT